MPLDKIFQDKKSPIRKKPQYDEAEGRHHKSNEATDMHGLLALQDQVGNHVVQRLLAQRKGDGAFELDKDAADQINQERGKGQSLDNATQEKMGAATGQDISEVKVHTSAEADTLSQQLGAKAFTTGQDIFFRQGAYDSHSGAGQELLAHELTHVAQQSSGAVSAHSGAMTVNAPDDAYEQQADAVAKTVTNPGPQPAAEESATIARQVDDEEEKAAIQMQAEEEEAAIQEPTEMETEEESAPPEMVEEEMPEEIMEDLVQTQAEGEEECEGC